MMIKGETKINKLFAPKTHLKLTDVSKFKCSVNLEGRSVCDCYNDKCLCLPGLVGCGCHNDLITNDPVSLSNHGQSVVPWRHCG